MDAIAGVAGNDVAGTCEDAADRVVRSADEDPGAAVGNSRGPGSIDADEVISDEIQGRPGRTDVDAIAMIPGNNVAAHHNELQAARHDQAANAVGRGAVEKEDAVVAVGDSAGAGRVGADVIECKHVAVAVVKCYAVGRVTGNGVAGRDRAAARDRAADGIG